MPFAPTKLDFITEIGKICWNHKKSISPYVFEYSTYKIQICYYVCKVQIFGEKATKIWPIFHFLFDITKPQIINGRLANFRGFLRISKRYGGFAIFWKNIRFDNEKPAKKNIRLLYVFICFI